MAAGTVRLKGYRETLRALENCQRGTGKAMLSGLEEAAEPVRSEWASRLGKYPGVSIGTIGPKTLAKGILVRQSARKVTGKRGDFGALQMRLGLAALFDKQDETEKAVEEALEKMTEGEGF